MQQPFVASLNVFSLNFSHVFFSRFHMFEMMQSILVCVYNINNMLNEKSTSQGYRFCLAFDAISYLNEFFRLKSVNFFLLNSALNHLNSKAQIDALKCICCFSSFACLFCPTHTKKKFFIVRKKIIDIYLLLSV